MPIPNKKEIKCKLGFDCKQPGLCKILHTTTPIDAKDWEERFEEKFASLDKLQNPFWGMCWKCPQKDEPGGNGGICKHGYYCQHDAGYACEERLNAIKNFIKELLAQAVKRERISARAEQKSKGHYQIKCRGCGNYQIWKRKK